MVESSARPDAERSRAVARASRRVAYFTQENEAEIWVLENIKEALARAR